MEVIEMKTVHEVSKLTGLTIRTLRHYDDIGLLKVQRTGEGVSNDRKLYSDEDIEKLFTIMIYKELDVPLKTIKEIMQSPSYDRSRSLEEQIEKLKAKRRHLSNIITCAEFIYAYGTELLSGNNFSPSGIDQMAKQIRSSHGYKATRKRVQSLDKNQLGSMVEELWDTLERLAKVSDLNDYSVIEACVTDFAKSFASIGNIEVTEGILTGLAFMFFSEDGAFSIAVDEIGGEETHLEVMCALLLVCLKSWSRSIIPLAHKAIEENSDSTMRELWHAMEKSFGKELLEGSSLQEYFDYVWVCFWTGMMLLDDEETLKALCLGSETRLTEGEVMLLQKRTADLIGVTANIDLGGK